MDYSGLAQTAVRLITDKGRSVTLTYKSTGIYNPDNDTMAGKSSAQATTKAVITDYRQRDIDGSMIKQGDKQALIFAKDLVRPSVNDTLTDNCVEYHIMFIDEISPGDTPLIYKLQLRK